MKIRAISIVVLITFISLLLHSCTEDASVNPTSKADEEAVIREVEHCQNNGSSSSDAVTSLVVTLEPCQTRISNPGELHNAVLMEFKNRHDLLGAEKMSVDEYIEQIVASTNMVFREHGIEASVSHDDAGRVINELVIHGRNGGYDFFSQRNELPVKMFAYLERALNADPGQMASYLRAVRSARERFKGDIERRRANHQEIEFRIDDEGGLNDPFVDKVFISTYIFWTDVVAEEQDGGDLGLDIFDLINDKYFPFEPDIMAAVLAAVVGLPIILSIFYPIIASTVCYLAPPSWSDYNYHTK